MFGLPSEFRIMLSQPSLAGVGTGAELGNIPTYKTISDIILIIKN